VFPFFVEQVRGSSEGIKAVTGRIYAMAGFAAALSARWLGRIGDSWGHKRLLVVSCIVAGAISLLHVLAWSTGALVALRVLFGFAAGGMIPAANAIIRQTQPDKNIGKAYGVTSSLTALGWGAGALSGGFVYRVATSQAGKTVGLRAPFALTGVLLGITAAVVALRVRAQPAGSEPHAELGPR
jgi:MFS family permease